MRSLLLIGLLVFSIICSADIYLQTDKNGNQIYSDTPTEGAQKIILPSTAPSTSNNNASKATTTTSTHATPDAAAQNSVYTQFLIDLPVDQQTITNQREIPVELAIKPDLQPGDKTQLYVDGVPAGIPAGNTHLQLKNLPRGTHQLYAVILDSNNSTIKQSQSITIFIHYASLGAAAN